MFPVDVAEIATVVLALITLCLVFYKLCNYKRRSTWDEALSRAPIAIMQCGVWVFWTGWSNWPSSIDSNDLAVLQNDWQKLVQRYDVKPQTLWQFKTGFPFTYEITNADLNLLRANSIAFSSRRLLQNLIVAMASCAAIQLSLPETQITQFNCDYIMN